VALVATTSACSSETPGLEGYGAPGNAVGAPVQPGGRDGMSHRDIDELERLEAVPRACVTNHDCPVGSHCDDDSRTCRWACLSDTDCEPGLTCTLAGECTLESRLFISNNTEGCLAMDPSRRLLDTLAVNSSNIT
jgi:hypothetical protein